MSTTRSAVGDTKPLPHPIYERLIGLWICGCYQQPAIIRRGEKEIVIPCERLTIAQLAELVIYHTRRALQALVRFDVSQSPHTAVIAARHLFLRYQFSTQREQLLGHSVDRRYAPFYLLRFEAEEPA